MAGVDPVSEDVNLEEEVNNGAINDEEKVVQDVLLEATESGSWLWFLLQCALVTLAIIGVLLLLLKILIVWKTKRQLRRWGFHLLPYRPVVVGFFHPYCNAGGGGERVLWQSVCALQKRYSFVNCVVYTGDKQATKPKQIMQKVKQRFGIELTKDVKFIFLKTRPLVEAKFWPRFTLLGQSFGSIFLGLEALIKLTPHVYIDTMGYAFTMPLFRWIGGSKTASYVHYPVVSSDMLEQVTSRVQAHNNADLISHSRLLTKLKVYYYRLFAKLYGFVGRRSDVVMVNSTWTHGHISKIWGSRKLFIVYPPCDTSAFQKLPIERSSKKFKIVSIGQFRPEKNHKLQLEVLKEFLSYLNHYEKNGVILVIIGSCRDTEDHNRADELKHMADQMGIINHVQFKVNIPFDELKHELSQATAALHTMWNEHFGIGLVECMAAGCIMIGHDSGGPRMDIVVDWCGKSTGYLADTTESYSSCLYEVFNQIEADRRKMVGAARESVQAKFSVEVFEASFLRATEHLFG